MGRFLFASDLAIRSNLILAVLSPQIAQTYKMLGGVPDDKIWIFSNGTRTDLIECRSPTYEKKAICVGKIEKRKNQKTLQACKQIDFVGPIGDTDFVINKNYIGTWTRKELYSRLTEYPCLVLLSEAEAHPLVIGEGLAAGCAILCSEVAAANLPRDKPWIRVIKDTKLSADELTNHIKELCTIGCEMRREIREWACMNLDWRLRAKTYLEKFSIHTSVTHLASDALRIALIGPGIMPIPPPGWGAVEQIIWDKAVILKEQGHLVEIINTPDRAEIIQKVNQGSFDVVHLHYDMLWDVIPMCKAKIRCITSWYPYIDNFEKWTQDGYIGTFRSISNLAQQENIYLYPASEKDRKVFIEQGGVDPSHVRLYKNGIHVRMYEIKETPHFGDRSVCLAKIEPRKRQHLTYWSNSIDYIGRGKFHHPNFRGELGHTVLYKLLTDYGNLIMLSDGENGTPLVVKEGMAAGLGCVLSKSAANELPPGLPWVTVLTEEQLANPSIVEYAIEENKKHSRPMRTQIRKWIKENWDLEVIVENYVKEIRTVLKSL
jgi:glycosyltransferase involved in cell wall biosynthesis